MKALGLAGIAAGSFALALPLITPETVEAGAKAIRAATSLPLPGVSEPARAQVSDQALYLIRSTLLALEGANRTGNYSVLRESATTEFQRRNSAADLGMIFADLRRRGIDLTPAAVAMPNLKTPSVPDAQGRLRLSGDVVAIPNPVVFDLVFIAVDGHWRLDGIAINAAAQPVAQRGG